jgi:L-asparagine oxygenase
MTSIASVEVPTPDRMPLIVGLRDHIGNHQRPRSIRRLLERHLTDSLSEPLRSLRRPDGPPALVVDGLPMIDDPGPTPVDGEPTDDRLPVGKEIVSWLAETMGVFLVGYPNIADGRVFHDVNPVRGTIRPLSSKGADLSLPFHSDSAANDDRPDFLVLWAIRAAAGDPVPTGYAEIGAALRLLDDTTIATLRQRRFRLQAPTIADLGPGDIDLSPPVALVSGPDEAPEVRVHTSRTDCLDPEAGAALDALTSALDRVCVDVNLSPGRLLIINNRRGVHRRNGFTPDYGPNERWLLRSYLMIDPWAHRQAVLDGRALLGGPRRDGVQVGAQVGAEVGAKPAVEVRV